MSSAYTFSPLTGAYLCDPRVEGAVDSLVGKKMAEGFDPEFDWSEFPSYVDAWLSAQQTVAEWCRACFNLWDLTWGGAIEGRASYRPRLDTFDELSEGGISECWFDNWLGRHVEVGGQTVGLDLHYDEYELYLGVEFKSSLRKAAWQKLGLSGWTLDDNQILSPRVEIDRAAGVAVVDLALLQSSACDALEALMSHD